MPIDLDLLKTVGAMCQIYQAIHRQNKTKWRCGRIENEFNQNSTYYVFNFPFLLVFRGECYLQSEDPVAEWSDPCKPIDEENFPPR